MKTGPSSRIGADAAFLKLQGKSAAGPTRVQAEIAAIANARDENMRRLRQLRLEREAQELHAAPAAKIEPKAQKNPRRPGKNGRG